MSDRGLVFHTNCDKNVISLDDPGKYCLYYRQGMLNVCLKKALSSLYIYGYRAYKVKDPKSFLIKDF